MYLLKLRCCFGFFVPFENLLGTCRYPHKKSKPTTEQHLNIMHRVTSKSFHFQNLPPLLRPKGKESDESSISISSLLSRQEKILCNSPQKSVRSILGFQNLTKRKGQPKAQGTLKAYSQFESLELELPTKYELNRRKTAAQDPDTFKAKDVQDAKEVMEMHTSSTSIETWGETVSESSMVDNDGFSFKARVARDAKENMEWHASISTIGTWDEAESVTESSTTNKEDGFSTSQLSQESRAALSPNECEFVAKGTVWCRSNSSRSRSHLELDIIPKQELATPRRRAVRSRRHRRRIKTRSTR